MLFCSFQDDIDLFIDAYNRRQHSLGASMKKTCSLTTTLLFGAHGGRIINGDTSAASRQFVIAIVQVLLVLRLLKLQVIL